MTDAERSAIYAFRSLEHGLRKEQHHQWVTVVNPTNRRTLLQACDNCGVVKSENTVVNTCSMPAGQALISSALHEDLRRSA